MTRLHAARRVTAILPALLIFKTTHKLRLPPVLSVACETGKPLADAIAVELSSPLAANESEDAE